MNKKELTEAFKIIYDSLSEGKDFAEEIKNLKDELEKRNFLLELIIRVFAPVVRSSSLSCGLKTTPFEMAKYIRNVIEHNVIDNQSVIDDKFIDEMIELMNVKNYQRNV